jgi:secondary thiamine-phosphate synthase enzyme
MVGSYVISLETGGDGDVIDLTSSVAENVKKSGIANGMVCVHIPGSTAGITTVEYEPGLQKDLPEFFKRIIPRGAKYHHDATWGDGNGFSHVRAALVGPSLTVPISSGKLVLGTWQQIVLLDFDNRPRKRKIVVQVMGE